MTEPEGKPESAESPAPAVRGSNKTAIVALVFGLCTLIPFAPLRVVCGLIAACLGLVALHRPTRKWLSLSGLLIGMAGIILGIYPFVVPTTKELSHERPCSARINAIGKGIAMYENENQDAMPPDLLLLIQSSAINREFLHCPACKPGRQSDYFYLPAQPYADGSTIVCCDFRTNHPAEGRYVLNAGFSVKLMKEADFQAELAKPRNAAFAKALRAAEGP